MELWRVDDGLGANFLAVAGLKFGSVLTLCYVDIGIVVSAKWTSINLNVDVFMFVVGESDVDVCTGVSAFRSEEKMLADEKVGQGLLCQQS